MSTLDPNEAVWTAKMAAEDWAQPLTLGGDQTKPAQASTYWPDLGAPGSVCERYVGRERMAQIMDLSTKSVDRLVSLGMPSETWGLRTRRFLPSAALAWAQARQEMGV